MEGDATVNVLSDSFKSITPSSFPVALCLTMFVVVACMAFAGCLKLNKLTETHVKWMLIIAGIGLFVTILALTFTPPTMDLKQFVERGVLKELGTMDLDDFFKKEALRVLRRADAEDSHQINEVNRRIDELQTEVQDLRIEMHTALQEMRAEMQAALQDLRTEMQTSKKKRKLQKGKQREMPRNILETN
eukprot:TRINITY_DN47554_c0_g1_i1.p1 TRINITY_DN47554_c0_g1~~TRINITY_DN47554_c0_g1_i1.p1  ORF type:complete len:189 (-),score=46.34 TRINITY_DN47554_c0_g1_i1:22-588(-)